MLNNVFIKIPFRTGQTNICFPQHVKLPPPKKSFIILCSKFQDVQEYRCCQQTNSVQLFTIMEEENAQKTEEGTESTIPEEELLPTEGMTENEIVVIILVVTLIGVLVFGFYIYSNRRFYGIGISSG
jgi:hypothetical protein